MPPSIGGRTRIECGDFLLQLLISGLERCQLFGCHVDVVFVVVGLLLIAGLVRSSVPCP